MFPLIHHSHHVTRDVNADCSANTHWIKFRFIYRGVVFNITGCVAGMTRCLATVAIAWDILKDWPICHCETICFPNFHRSVFKTLWQDVFGSQLIRVSSCTRYGRKGNGQSSRQSHSLDKKISPSHKPTVVTGARASQVSHFVIVVTIRVVVTDGRL
jgi:hypothetical protein